MPFGSEIARHLIHHDLVGIGRAGRVPHSGTADQIDDVIRLVQQSAVGLGPAVAFLIAEVSGLIQVG